MNSINALAAVSFVGMVILIVLYYQLETLRFKK
jgi:hypothetical protein